MTMQDHTCVNTKVERVADVGFFMFSPGFIFCHRFKKF